MKEIDRISKILAKACNNDIDLSITDGASTSLSLPILITQHKKALTYIQEHKLHNNDMAIVRKLVLNIIKRYKAATGDETAIKTMRKVSSWSSAEAQRYYPLWRLTNHGSALQGQDYTLTYLWGFW